MRGIKTAIQNNLQLRSGSRKTARPIIIKGWNVTVFLGAQPLQPGFAGMQIHHPDTGPGNMRDKIIQTRLGVHIINANAAFDCHRQVGCPPHGGHAFSYQCGFSHQASAEPARLNTVGRTADIQIDFSISIGCRRRHRLRQARRITATKLQRCRNCAVQVGPCKRQQPVTIAMNDRLGSHHFGEAQCRRCNQPVKQPAMPVRPVHHGGNT